MTIGSLAESFHEAKAKAGHPARFKYPKKLKYAASECFKANPSLIPSRITSMIWIPTRCADKWFKSVKQAKEKHKIKTDPPNLKHRKMLDRNLANNGELRVHIIEVSIPTTLGVMLFLNSDEIA